MRSPWKRKTCVPEKRHGAAAGRHAPQVAGVCAGERPAGDQGVAILDPLIDDERGVGHGVEDREDPLPHALGADGQVAPHRVVVDVVVGEQLVDDVAAGVPGLVHPVPVGLAEGHQSVASSRSGRTSSAGLAAVELGGRAQAGEEAVAGGGELLPAGELELAPRVVGARGAMGRPVVERGQVVDGAHGVLLRLEAEIWSLSRRSATPWEGPQGVDCAHLCAGAAAASPCRGDAPAPIRPDRRADAGSRP